MENKTNTLIESAIKIMGDDADILIISHKDGKCAGATHGDAESIAQALFACMHNADSPFGQSIYRILKLNVMNILANPSPYAADLINAINHIQSASDE